MYGDIVKQKKFEPESVDRKSQAYYREILVSLLEILSSAKAAHYEKIINDFIEELGHLNKPFASFLKIMAAEPFLGFMVIRRVQKLDCNAQFRIIGRMKIFWDGDLQAINKLSYLAHVMHLWNIEYGDSPFSSPIFFKPILSSLMSKDDENGVAFVEILPAPYKILNSNRQPAFCDKRRGVAWET
jgi:hypothetical protein